MYAKIETYILQIKTTHNDPKLLILMSFWFSHIYFNTYPWNWKVTQLNEGCSKHIVITTTRGNQPFYNGIDYMALLCHYAIFRTRFWVISLNAMFNWILWNSNLIILWSSLSPLTWASSIKATYFYRSIYKP